jgi:hypothetical protein
MLESGMNVPIRSVRPSQMAHPYLTGTLVPDLAAGFSEFETGGLWTNAPAPNNCRDRYQTVLNLSPGGDRRPNLPR